MEYLRGNATASATGLFVICRHLSYLDDGQPDEDLRRSLQPLRATRDGGTDSGAVMAASLTVGEGLGMLTRGSPAAPWILEESLRQGLKDQSDAWDWFRGELLRRMMRHALDQIENEGKAPDLIIGLTWFLQQSPLEPIQLAWGAGPEPLVRSIGLAAVARSEQWTAFQRWAIATGLARRADVGSAKVLIPDTTTAIADQLDGLPATGSARDWLAALRTRLPILGSPDLLAQLPQGPVWKEVPPGVELGLLKLEKVGALALRPSDDDADIVTVGLGRTGRQIGRINVNKAAA